MMADDRESLFGNLLFSAPNNLGGLYAIMADGRMEHLDERGTCGIRRAADGRLLRAVQQGDILSVTDDAGTREFTGDWSDLHDVLLDGADAYFVSTRDNAVIRWNTHEEKETERWVFSDQEDAWHINCLGWLRKELCFTAFGEFPITRGYKADSRERGFLRRLQRNRNLSLIAGLSQPHTILECGDEWFLCNSENGEIWHGHGHDGPQPIIALDGYTRGLAIRDGVLYAGLSASRNVVDDAHPARARIVAIDRSDWREISRIDLPSMEVYDILALPDAGNFLHLVTRILIHERVRLLRQRNAAAEKLATVVNENVRLKLCLGIPTS